MKIEVNDANFKQEVLEAKIPVLVDFWAEWCMPCKMLEPVVNELADEYNGKIKVCSLNVDDSRVTAGEYNIMSIPTIAIFDKGRVIDTVVGAVPKGAITERITKLLGT
ncbi:MAG: thioredoxin [Elusimicrobiota bacterium]